MKNNPPLTAGYHPVLAHQIEKTRAGMASWAAQGPFGAVCSDCVFYGYHQLIRDAAGNAVKTRFRERCCEMFFRLTQRHGPPVPANSEACRHFKRREDNP
jgi:hypothetical protein